MRRTRYISFAWTTDAYKAKQKVETRRYWDDKYASSFKEGEHLTAMDKAVFAHGNRIGEIVLTKKPYKQRTSLMTEADFKDEGLLWMEQQGLLIKGQKPREFFDQWKAKDEEVWVIEFEILSVV